MTDMHITIYTKANCPNCVTAKLILDSVGLTYDEVDIMVGQRMANFMDAYPDVRGMPQIFINDQRVGGLLGLQEALRQLDKL
jgi:glutaredoxin 3